jgi:DNA-binding response OmpR family regulator
MPAVILLVDDDEILPYVLSRGLSKNGFAGKLQCVSDGQAGIDYLSRKGSLNPSGEFPHPTVVLLDLNMPGIHGFDLLEWKSKRAELVSLPVVVWSSSGLSEDREKALALGAVDYIQKPMNLDELLAVIEQLAVRYPHST